MSAKPRDLGMTPLDDLFSTDESRAEAQLEKVVTLNPADISDFPNHPFKVKQDEAMAEMVDSVKLYGVLAPALVRPKADGGYEMVAGHRRKCAATLAGITEMPCIVRNLTDDEATIIMVDSNLQREHILPSERAFAYKMKLEAIKRTAGRPSKNVSQIGTQKRSDQIMAEEMGESRNQIQRFIRFTNLIPELLDLVDQKKISFNPAVELSYLADSEQQDFLEAMQDTQNAPSLSQAQRIKKLSQEGQCSYEAIFDIMGEEKKAEMDRVTIKNDVLRKYFPKSYTPKQVEDTILKLLEKWQKKRQRSQER